jgi:3-methyladenine DNA glycosylase AlkD
MHENDSIDKYIENITKAYVEKANLEYAPKIEQYMRNKFEFFGIKAQARRQATRKFMRKNNRPSYDEVDIVVKKLWNLPEREYQYFAMELLERYKNKFTKEIIKLFEYMITHKSWWDTIDRISKKLVGEYFKFFPDERDYYMESWVDSGNIWLQRTTLLFQLAYKEDTDIQLLFTLIKQLKDIDEFFIQKAIGWSLREYSKIEPGTVKQFINENELSSLSERDGLKVIKRSK